MQQIHLLANAYLHMLRGLIDPKDDEIGWCIIRDKNGTLDRPPRKSDVAPQRRRRLSESTVKKNSDGPGYRVSTG